MTLGLMGTVLQVVRQVRVSKKVEVQVTGSPLPRPTGSNQSRLQGAKRALG